MVKTTYALTLFAAVSLAAPVSQLTGRAEKQVSAEHKNILQGLPIINQRDESEPEHHNVIDELPIIGKILGNDKENQNQRRDITNEGISGLPLVGGLFGKHTHTGGANGVNKRQGFGQNYGQNAGQNEGQNYGQNAGQNQGQNQGQNEGQNEGQNQGQNEGQNNGQNASQNGEKGWKRDLGSSLRGIPIVGGLLGKDQEKPSHRQVETPAKHIDTRQAGHAKGVFGVLESLTSGQPINKGQKRDEEFEELEPMGDVLEGAVASGMEAESSVMPVRRNEPAAPKANNGQQADPKKPKNEQSKGLLGELMGKNGLGAIKGNSHHGLGLFPMRRDEKDLETRQAPIQGSTLTGVLLQGGALGKLSKALSGGAASEPGAIPPSKIGDGSSAAPPDPSSGVGPHSGPGLAAQKQQAGAAF
ncbi:hypothetical protein EN45_049570 [Penicillium chrysogenum]|uniref:Pc20g13710 protein n=2 Tax=Penicillium chrysogenum species complex TaxID=254878 RepID=B6HH08_PENRW|nr:hypothetical protein NUH16_010240 [Penicillium rubens]KZN86432.1 hypothetical protein EN45_049570 [Penicillium chrysogenum]CAP86700.1 Pc20g13710 [Penicillium rubens Wisconsin 54-1255]